MRLAEPPPRLGDEDAVVELDAELLHLGEDAQGLVAVAQAVLPLANVEQQHGLTPPVADLPGDVQGLHPERDGLAVFAPVGVDRAEVVQGHREAREVAHLVPQVSRAGEGVVGAAVLPAVLVD